MAAEDYEAGDVKWNPETKAVAVRTVFPDIPALADRQWGVMTVDNGGHYAKYSAVESWVDMVESEDQPEEEEDEEEEGPDPE